MKYEINEKTGLPAVVALRETFDGHLVVFTFCENHPVNPEDWGRDGVCRPTYFMVLGHKLYTFDNRDEMWTMAGRVPLMTRDDVLTTILVGRRFR